MRHLLLLAIIAIAACGGSTPAVSDSRSEVNAPTASAADSDGPFAETAATLRPPPENLCQAYGSPVVSATVEDGRLLEVSGIVRSRRYESITWMHNDSGDGAVLYAVDGEGRTVAAFNLGVLTLDAEDLAIGPGPGDADYLYFADIGDNFNFRPVVSVYRFPEPDPAGTEIGPVERIDLVYPGGPVNAEALAVDPVTGAIIVITKVEDRPATVLWGAASDLIDTGTVSLVEIATLDLSGRVTGADISPSGDRLVLRGYDHIWMWSRSSLDLGEVFAQTPCELEAPSERQGESIAFGQTDDLFTVSEGRNPSIFRLPNS